MIPELKNHCKTSILDGTIANPRKTITKPLNTIGKQMKTVAKPLPAARNQIQQDFSKPSTDFLSVKFLFKVVAVIVPDRPNRFGIVLVWLL